MQKFTHTANNSIVKVKYVYRQIFLSRSFMLFIFKSVEKVLLNASDLSYFSLACDKF